MQYSLYSASQFDFAMAVLLATAAIIAVLMLRLVFEAWLDSGSLEDSTLFRMLSRWYLWWARFFDERDDGRRIDEIHRR